MALSYNFRGVFEALKFLLLIKVFTIEKHSLQDWQLAKNIEFGKTSAIKTKESSIVKDYILHFNKNKKD